MAHWPAVCATGRRLGAGRVVLLYLSLLWRKGGIL
jgi:hypothetical protein